MDRSTSSLEDIELQVKDRTRKEHAEALDIAEQLLNAYIDGFQRLGSFTLREDNKREYAWLLLTTRAFNTLRCAYLLLQLGYYSQAIILIRSADEDWLVCKDCVKQLGTVDALLQGKQMPRFSEMAKRQGPAFDSQWQGANPTDEGTYGFLSTIAHPRQRAIKVIVDPDTKDLAFGGRYDAILFVYCIVSLVSSILSVFEFVGRVVYAEADKKWPEEVDPLFKKARSWLKEYAQREASTS